MIDSSETGGGSPPKISSQPEPWSDFSPPRVKPVKPLGDSAAEQVPIGNFVAAMEAILREPRRVLFQLGQQHSARLLLCLLAVTFICSLVYGLIVGTFSGGAQLWAAPAKISIGVLLSAVICLPSLYIFTCLSGSEARLAQVAGILTGLLALTAVLLIGFAPVAWVFSQSTESTAIMGTLHLMFWFIAVCFGVRFLWQGFRHLKAAPSSGLALWIFIFLIVALQMMTALRPLIGTAPTVLPKEKKFFLSHWADCVLHDQQWRSAQ